MDLSEKIVNMMMVFLIIVLSYLCRPSFFPKTKCMCNKPRVDAYQTETTLRNVLQHIYAGQQFLPNVPCLIRPASKLLLGYHCCFHLHHRHFRYFVIYFRQRCSLKMWRKHGIIPITDVIDIRERKFLVKYDLPDNLLWTSLFTI